jgi:uncharacterized protein YjbI with pentapeptide repeats
MGRTSWASGLPVPESARTDEDRLFVGLLGKRAQIQILMASTIPAGQHHCEDVCISDTKFKNVALLRAKFEDVALADARFQNINFSGATFDDVNLSDVQITNANVEGMTIFGVKVSDLLEAHRARGV